MSQPQTFELPKESFGKTIAKTLVLSTASSAGVWGGLIIAGSVASLVQRRKKDREDTTSTEE